MNIDFSFDKASIDMQIDKSPPLTFASNNALTVDQGNISFFESLDNAISSVKSQNIRANSNSDDPRSIGVQNSINVVDHMLDHINRLHTQNGSTSNTLIVTREKSVLMELNVKELSSMAIDTDIGEAMLIMNQRSLAYQSLLATISKISQLNLVNYI
jgi:flagellar hook-associated protein 3 FlgL